MMTRREAIRLRVRRMAAAITLFAAAGTLVPVAAPADRHCAPRPVAAAVISAAGGPGCHMSMALPCDASGCLVQEPAVLLGPAIGDFVAFDAGAILPRTPLLSGRPALGPPTPPPNS